MVLDLIGYHWGYLGYRLMVLDFDWISFGVSRSNRFMVLEFDWISLGVSRSYMFIVLEFDWISLGYLGVTGL